MGWSIWKTYFFGKTDWLIILRELIPVKLLQFVFLFWWKIFQSIHQFYICWENLAWFNWLFPGVSWDFQNFRKLKSATTRINKVQHPYDEFSECFLIDPFFFSSKLTIVSDVDAIALKKSPLANCGWQRMRWLWCENHLNSLGLWCYWCRHWKSHLWQTVDDRRGRGHEQSSLQWPEKKENRIENFELSPKWPDKWKHWIEELKLSQQRPRKVKWKNWIVTVVA